MKITSIEAVLVNFGKRNVRFVQVRTGEGIIGLGEAYSCGPDKATVEVIRHFALRLEGRDPRDVEALYHLTFAGSRFPGGSVLGAAISGIASTPCGTSRARPRGFPVYRLLGGRAPPVPAVAPALQRAPGRLARPAVARRPSSSSIGSTQTRTWRRAGSSCRGSVATRRGSLCPSSGGRARWPGFRPPGGNAARASAGRTPGRRPSLREPERRREAGNDGCDHAPGQVKLRKIVEAHPPVRLVVGAEDDPHSAQESVAEDLEARRAEEGPRPHAAGARQAHQAFGQAVGLPLDRAAAAFV